MRSASLLAFSSCVAFAFVAGACSSSSDSAAPSSDSGSIVTDSGARADTATNDTATDTPATTKDIVDTAVAAGTFKTLVAAVQAAGLEATLRSAGPFTVFAPSDSAFKANVPDFLLTELTTPPYKTELGFLLKYHVLSGEVKSTDVLGKSQTVTTVAGAPLTVDGSSGKVVLEGDTNVTTADVLASNGVIHVIDRVLLPTIVDTASNYDDGTNKFSTLVSAVKAADLVGTLSGPGTFTVFAPTDKAFDDLRKALGDATFSAILADKAKLTKVLTYHVLPAIAFAKDVKTGSVKTVEGDTLQLTASGGKVTIGDSTTTAANVVLADLPNHNGVIHVIDKVLVPPGL